MKRYALLDTDFISKTHSVQDDGGNHLIDRVMECRGMSSFVILNTLALVRGPLACATYTQMLKLACDAFSRDYFSEHYRALEEADYAAISREDYSLTPQLTS